MHPIRSECMTTALRDLHGWCECEQAWIQWEITLCKSSGSGYFVFCCFFLFLFIYTETYRALWHHSLHPPTLYLKEIVQFLIFPPPTPLPTSHSLVPSLGPLAPTMSGEFGNLAMPEGRTWERQIISWRRKGENGEHTFSFFLHLSLLSVLHKPQGRVQVKELNVFRTVIVGWKKFHRVPQYFTCDKHLGYLYSARESMAYLIYRSYTTVDF